MDFGLSLINCRKNAPFTNYVSETSEVLNVELLRCDSRERQKDGAHHRFYEDTPNGQPIMRLQLLGMVQDRVTTVHTYNKNLAQTDERSHNKQVWVFLYLKKRLDKAFEFVYTNSVVNEKGDSKCCNQNETRDNHP